MQTKTGVNEMKILDDVITPNVGVGGIYLGENVNDIFSKLDKLGYEISYVCDNCIKIQESFLDIYFDPASCEISLISCGVNFNGYYKTSKGRIWGGMSVADILQNTTEQVAWGGFVAVDRICGIGFPLPQDFDDFSELTDFLDYDFVFKELSVYKDANANNLKANKRRKQ